MLFIFENVVDILIKSVPEKNDYDQHDLFVELYDL